MITYGIYDTRDNVWIGDKVGPRLYNIETLAHLPVPPKTDDEVLEIVEVVAVMLAGQIGISSHLFRPIPYEGGANKLRDEIPIVCDGAASLKSYEEGRRI